MSGATADDRCAAVVQWARHQNHPAVADIIAAAPATPAPQAQLPPPPVAERAVSQQGPEKLLSCTLQFLALSASYARLAALEVYFDSEDRSLRQAVALFVGPAVTVDVPSMAAPCKWVALQPVDVFKTRDGEKVAATTTPSAFYLRPHPTYTQVTTLPAGAAITSVERSGTWAQHDLVRGPDECCSQRGLM